MHPVHGDNVQKNYVTFGKDILHENVNSSF